MLKTRQNKSMTLEVRTVLSLGRKQGIRRTVGRPKVDGDCLNLLSLLYQLPWTGWLKQQTNVSHNSGGWQV